MNLILLAIALFASFSGSAGAAALREGEQRIPGTNVSLRAPEGFELSESFAGFYQASTGASLLVVEVEAGFDEVAVGWEDSAALAEQGMTLLASESMPLDSNPGLLCKVAQDAGTIQVTKWVWIFGTDQHSVLVVGNCPDEFVDSSLSSIREGVLSAIWNPAEETPPKQETAFTIGYAGEFQARPSGAQLIYSIDGEIDETGQQPIFLAGPSSAPASGDLASFSDQRLRATAFHSNFEVQSAKPIEIDGLSGWEIRASAVDERGDLPKSIYQVVLFEGKSYWLLQGLVSAGMSDKYVPEFVKMAQSFRRKLDLLSSQSGLVSISVPTSWSMRSGLAEDVEIQAGHPVADCYLIIGSAPKDAFPDGFDQYADLIVSDFENTDDEQGQGETTVDGMRTLLREYVVSEGDLKIAYFIAIVDGRLANHALIFWSLANEQEIARPEFRRILSTFRENE